MKKWIRKWWRKLRVGIVAAGKSENMNKAKIAAIAIAATSATVQAQTYSRYTGGSQSFDSQNTGGYYYSTGNGSFQRSNWIIRFINDWMKYWGGENMPTPTDYVPAPSGPQAGGSSNPLMSAAQK
jgi:hypothetical protein